MYVPLVTAANIEAFGAGPIFVLEQRDQDVRDTAEHAHDPGQLIGSLRGLLSVKTREGAWVVPATHAIWMPPRHPHALRSHGTFEGWSVYVAEAACADLPAAPRTVRVSGLLREAVHRAAQWGRIPASPSECRLAVVLLEEIAALPEEPLGLPLPSDPRAQRVAEAMLSDLANGDTLEVWASWGGISSRTLARRFTEQTGLGFTDWRQRARALRSIAMLAEGQSVTTIAIDMGYDNVSAFIAMFRRAIGTTPGRYDPEQAHQQHR